MALRRIIHNQTEPYQQLSPAEVHAQLDRVVEQLREPFPQVADLLADAAPDILAFTAFPVAHRQKLWSNNPQERLNKEIRRRRACPCRGRGGYLPQPAVGTAPGVRGAGRTARRMGRGPPLPHHPQRRRQRGNADAQHAGCCGLININKDYVLLHLLYVAVAPWMGQSAGWARGARRSPLGEPGYNPGLHRRQVGHPSQHTPSPHTNLRTQRDDTLEE